MFFDREKELKELMGFVGYGPNSMMFVYGSINSGKNNRDDGAR
ncbi:ATP-binding protein [Pyrococcus kukulkanii]|uniref:ATP-binding protein n=1 Tax=Pyrococcus kukulkanii TaxID=1609559 RepID=A0ABV4T4G2_9EURY|nr:ATP-binding protein [Pyrococcus kukulkanii]